MLKNILLLLVLLSTCSYATPSWYHNIHDSKANVYIGFGSASSEAKAKQLALSDIVSQISVHVSSSMKSSMKELNGKFSSSDEFKTEQNAEASLSDYKLLKSEFDESKYYVALSYENIPSFDKFVKKVKNLGLDKFVQKPKLKTYYSSTTMAKKLYKALGRDIDFKLIRKDKKWFIKHKDILQILDKKDFAKFFTTVDSQNITINTNKKNNILYNDMKFFFKVKSSKKGFISILSVYEDATVATLVRNIPIGKNKLENIPDEDFESIPQASLMKRGIETFDLYVAIYSTKKLHFDSFAYADSELVNEEKYKNFDELIEFIEDKDYATLKVVTKPKMN